MKTIYFYTHTHWDREWYQAFESFRVQLLSVLKIILSELETGRLEKFYLDGQAIILEDALEIDPQLAERISAQMSKGSLEAGPWYVLPDEMLVCGESLLRNLKFGIDCVSRFGKPALVGYSPDTFGHTQDLPRLLAGFGIQTAFVWRGVPALSYGPCFWWQSPDGSKVLAYHLSKGYYQSALIEKSAGGLSESAAVELSEQIIHFASDRGQWDNSSLYEKTPEQILLPVGADHTAPPRNLVASIALLNKKMEKKSFHLHACHLTEFGKIVLEDASAQYRMVGLLARELRDNCAAPQYANAYLLPGVLSSRLYLKRENREAERLIFRFWEPLMTGLHLRKLHSYPQGLLKHATRLLLKNHPHDSVCGCSVDAVHEEMMTRFARLKQVCASSLEEARIVLSGMSEDSSLSPADPAAGLKRLRVLNAGGRAFTGVVPLSWFSKQGVKTPDSEYLQIDKTEPVDQLFAGFGRLPYYSLLDRHTGYIYVENLPAFAESNIEFPPQGPDRNRFAAVSLKAKTMDNGILSVSVDERDGIKVSIREDAGSLRVYKLRHEFVDCADAGDTYNFDPLLHDKPIRGKLVSVKVGKRGPLVGSLLVKYELNIPESLITDGSDRKSGISLFKRSSRCLKHVIETELLLKRGSEILEFETTFVNQSCGHRLELLLATGDPIHVSLSENHFSLLRRHHQSGAAHRKPKLPVPVASEAPSDRFPTQRFVIANGQVFLNKGLPEYGVEDQFLRLTLLRSVSILSRGRMQTRGGGAGPQLSVPGAESKGLNRCSYAWAPLLSKPRSKVLAGDLPAETIAHAYDLCEAYEHELFTAFSSSADSSCNSLIQVENDFVRVLSFYVSDDGESCFLRLLNVTNQHCAGKVLVDFSFQSAHLCRLDEEIAEEVFLYREYENDAEDIGKRNHCALSINFGPNELKTVCFRLRPASQERQPAARSRKKRSASKTG